MKKDSSVPDRRTSVPVGSGANAKKLSITDHVTPQAYMAIPDSVNDPVVWRGAVRYQFWYSVLGLVLGLACILSGVILFLHGVVATTKSWTTSVLGLQNSVSDVPAGVVVFIVGMIIVFITRFSVKGQKTK